jgi:hypothetical protein
VTESHFLTSQASEIDSDDIFDSIRLITRKGYGTQSGSHLLILANPQWRHGLGSRPAEGSETEGPISQYDFIPASA